MSHGEPATIAEVTANAKGESLFASFRTASTRLGSADDLSNFSSNVCQARHRGREFVKFLQRLEQEVPPDLETHLFVDNYSMRKDVAVQRWLMPKARRRFHFPWGSDSPLTSQT